MNGLISALRTRTRTRGRSDDAAARTVGGPESRIVGLVRVLLLFESAMYSAVTPVLPHYAHVLHAGKPGVGLLAATYPAGILPGSLLGAWIAVRAGVRRTTLVGLVLFAVAIAAFGFGSDIVVLDVLRFLQGAGSGLIWAGGLTWLIAVAPRERRGAVFGSAMGAAIFGTLLGPVLGTLAVALGTGPVFSLVALASFALAARTLRHPEPPARTTGAPETETPVRTLLGTPRILLGAWLILLEAAAIGATGTLVPLRMAHLGAPGVAIGITFLVASFVSMMVAGPIGRLVDRRGAGLPLATGLILAAVLLAVLAVPRSAVALAVLSVIVLGGPLTAYTIPSMSIITDAAERVGLPIIVATMMLNLAWAFGETLGAPAAANIAQATSDTVPLLMLSAIMVLTLPAVIRARLRPLATAPEPGAAQTPDPKKSEPTATEPGPATAEPAPCESRRRAPASGYAATSASENASHTIR